MKCINDIENVPAAIGPYSQATSNGDLFFFSGQIPLNPQTGKIESLEVEDQVSQIVRNIDSLLKGVELSKTNILKTTIFLTDMSDFSKVNEIYSEWLGDHKPARSTVAVAALPLGALVEIEVIAVK